jgi:ribonuclease-3
VAQPWLESSLETRPDSLLSTDAKTTLQELAQSRDLDLPDYRHVAEEGPDHRKRFHVECWVGGELWGSGNGASKKEAEQHAARAALAAIPEISGQQRR